MVFSIPLAWYKTKALYFKGKKMIELNEQTNESISNILKKYIIENNIDDDGDIFVESAARIYIRVDKEKGMLRFFSFIQPAVLESVSLETIDKYINFINMGSYTVKYSRLKDEDKKSPLICEYGLILDGFVDDSFLIKTLRKIEKEIISAKNLATKYDSLMDEMKKNAQEANS